MCDASRQASWSQAASSPWLEGHLAVMLHRYATLHPTTQCPLPSCVAAAAYSLLLAKTRTSISHRMRG